MESNTIQIGNVGMGPNPTTKDSVTAQLNLCDPSLPVYVDIHSQGGSVFEGFAIYNLLKEWSGKTIARVKTAAFSIASYIAMAADEVEIADNGFFMVHNPFDEAGGDDEELLKKAALLKDMRESMMDAYAAKTGLALALVQDLMKKESFIGAKDAINLGLADRVIDMTPANQSTINCRKLFSSRCIDGPKATHLSIRKIQCQKNCSPRSKRSRQDSLKRPLILSLSAWKKK